MLSTRNLKKNPFEFMCSVKPRVRIRNKVKRKEFSPRLTLDLKKARKVLKRFKVETPEVPPEVGEDKATRWKILKTFELAVQASLGYVFGANSPEDYRPGFSPAEVVSAAIGMSAEEFLQSAATQVSVVSQDDLTSSWEYTSFSEPDATTVKNPVPVFARFNPDLPVEPSETAGGSSWSPRRWRESYGKELQGLFLPSSWEIKKTAVLLRGVYLMIEHLKSLGIYSKPDVDLSKYKTLGDLEKLHQNPEEVQRVRRKLTEWMDEVNSLVGRQKSYETSGDLLRFVFESLYTYSLAFKTAADKTGLRYTTHSDTPLEFGSYGSTRVTISRKVDFGQAWYTNPAPDKPKLSQWKPEKGWKGSFQDAISEIAKGMAHEHIEMYIKEKVPAVRYERVFAPGTWNSDHYSGLTEQEREYNFSYKWDTKGAGHHIVQAYNWHLDSSGFFYALSKMQQPSEPVSLETIIERYKQRAWCYVEGEDDPDENPLGDEYEGYIGLWIK